jgi:hypothetical protein
MDNLERWLRTAMHEARQNPPVNLLSGVWERRRRHLLRMRIGGVAAVAAAAIAIPSVLQVTLPGASKPTGPAAAVKTPPGAAPGSELLKCGDYSDRGISGGQLSAHWKAASTQVGPVWFVFARQGWWRSSQRLADGRFRNVGGPVIAVRNGTTVEITTPAADRSRFRFPTSRTGSGTYTLGDGVAGLTVVACPYQRVRAGIPESDAPGLTLFYLPLGYVTNLTGCLPLQIATPPAWRVRWTAELPVHGGSCTQGWFRSVVNP